MQIIREGDRFGALLVLEDAGRANDGHRIWRCLCDCGATAMKQSNNLKASPMASCGCLARASAKAAHTIHGMRRSTEYASWSSAKDRCHNSSSKDFKRYGGRGISMSPEWRESFEVFFSDMGSKPHGHTLERKDTNGGYSRDNCIWATPKDQARNRRRSIYLVWRGKSTHLSEIAAELNITYGAAYQRLKRGSLDASHN